MGLIRRRAFEVGFVAAATVLAGCSTSQGAGPNSSGTSPPGSVSTTTLAPLPPGVTRPPSSGPVGVDPGSSLPKAPGSGSGAQVLSQTSPSTVVPVVVPVVPDAHPSGIKPEGATAAAKLDLCATSKDCHGVTARQIAWAGAPMADVDLSYAVMTGSYLAGLRAHGGQLQVANFSGSDLTGADLSDANLSGTDLTGTVLTGADLRGANLRGARLEGAIVDGLKLDGALICQTGMPDGSTRNDDC